MCQMDLWYFFIVVRENKYRENNNIEIYFFLFSYFCLDTKVPKNQGKKNAARSTIHSTSASAFCRACAGFVAERVLFWLGGLLFEKQNRILDYQGLLIVFDGLYFLPDNNNLRYIQELLGHKSIKTTEIYTHVTEKSLKNIISPFDT